jgi:hypothetical protein
MCSSVQGLGYKVEMLNFVGVRLTAHAANRLIREDGKFAVIAACAAGGQVCSTFQLHVILFHEYYAYCLFVVTDGRMDG